MLVGEWVEREGGAEPWEAEGLCPDPHTAFSQLAYRKRVCHLSMTPFPCLPNENDRILTFMVAGCVKEKTDPESLGIGQAQINNQPLSNVLSSNKIIK